MVLCRAVGSYGVRVTGGGGGAECRLCSATPPITAHARTVARMRLRIFIEPRSGYQARRRRGICAGEPRVATRLPDPLLGRTQIGEAALEVLGARPDVI